MTIFNRVKPEWSVGLSHCYKDIPTCCITCLLPCVTFGRIAEIYIKDGVKWIPGLKKQSLEIVAYLEPNIELLTAKTIDIYHASKSSVAPCVFKAQEMANPHIQVAKKFTEPYIAHLMMVIDEATMVTRTHLANIHIALQPYTKQVLHACRKFIKSATFYHHEVQEMLKNNTLTQSLATIELAWLLATALLALPAVLMFKLTSVIFRKRANKRIHRSYAYHTRRKPKRADPDK